MQPLAIVNAAQIVTLAGPPRPRFREEMRDIGVWPNAGMLVENGAIHKLDISEAIEAEGLAMGAEIVDARGKVVLPGWVDAHTHAIFGGNRTDEYEMRSRGASYEEIAVGGGGIRSTMEKTRAASEDELVAVGRRHAEWFLRGGTTTIEAKSGYGLTLEHEMRILFAVKRLASEGSLAWEPTFLGAHATPPEFEGRIDEYAEYVAVSILPIVAEAGVAKWCDIFVEEGYFSSEHAQQIIGRAKELGLGGRMHVDQLTNGGGAALAAKLGARTADHLEQTEADGIAALAATWTAASDPGTFPVLLPASVFALGKTRYPRARDMIDAGLPVVLATDFNPGSSPTTSMPLVLSLACTQMRMTPAEAVTAATINAAYCLDLGQDRGSLEAGKRADFAIYDCPDYREIPYWLGASLVDAVYVQGVRVLG